MIQGKLPGCITCPHKKRICMRRKIVSNAIASLTLVLLFKFSAFSQENAAKYDSREYWVATMIKIADPVLKNLSQGQLRAKMPVINKDSNRVNVAHLEAFGRTLAGIAPWLELGVDNTSEGKLREKLSLIHISEPTRLLS